jgi:hypothetical protein
MHCASTSKRRRRMFPRALSCYWTAVRWGALLNSIRLSIRLSIRARVFGLAPQLKPAAPFFLASSSLRAWHVWFVSSYAQGSWEAFEDDRGWTDCATLASKPLTSAGSLLPPAGLWSLQHTADRSLLLLISTPQFMHVLLSIASTGRDAGLRCLVLQLLVDWACAVHSPNDEFVPAFAQARHVRSRPMPSLRFGVKG